MNVMGVQETSPIMYCGGIHEGTIRVLESVGASIGKTFSFSLLDFFVPTVTWSSSFIPFLDASTHLYMRLCPSVGPLVSPSSVRPLVRPSGVS